VFPADLAVELRAWPYGTWARLGVDLQAAAAAVIAAWRGGHVKGLRARRADRRGGPGPGAAGHDLCARAAPRAARPAALAGLAPVAAFDQRTPPRRPLPVAADTRRLRQDLLADTTGRLTARSARTLDTGHRRSRPVGRTRTRSQAAADRPATALRTQRPSARLHATVSGPHTANSTAVACGSSGPGPSPAAPTRVGRSVVAATRLPVSTKVAAVRSAAGHRSGASDRRRHRHGHRHQPGHACRTPVVRGRSFPKQRTVNPLRLVMTSSTLPQAGPLRRQGACAGAEHRRALTHRQDRRPHGLRSPPP
jgi:hypothetical protein